MTEPSRRTSSIKAIAWLIFGLIASIFLAGVAAGYLDARAEDGATLVNPVFGAAIVGLSVAALTIIFVAPQLSGFRSLSPRRRLYWYSIGGASLLGLITSILFQIDGGLGASAASLFGNSPLSPDFALAIGALWSVGLLVSCIAYHRAVDDHEERAMLWAGLAGWYAFIIPAPAWWVLHRAALAPPVDVMQMFIFSMGVNAIVWLWLKFR